MTRKRLKAKVAALVAIKPLAAWTIDEMKAKTTPEEFDFVMGQVLADLAATDPEVQQRTDADGSLSYAYIPPQGGVS